MTTWQRACVFLGFCCLVLGLLALLESWQHTIACAILGLAWLIGSRLTWKD